MSEIEIQVNGNGNGKPGGITVFSGGTAANKLVDVFNRIIEKKACHLNYVIPISDNGGSSSELIRFIGGPSVGDIRSRLVRLIPTREDEENKEMAALKALFEHRLGPDPVKARIEWLNIVGGDHFLWGYISSPKMELIRSILNTLNLEIVKRARRTSKYNFAQASIGNMFLTGARIFSGSFESGIYLLSMICSIPSSVDVLPAINSNFTHHICAGLVDGTSITGQVAISHPSEPTALLSDDLLAPITPANGPVSDTEQDDLLHHDDDEHNLPGSLPQLRKQNITFSKDDEEDLPARIERLWYISQYGHEIWPRPNPKVLEALRSSTAVIYSIGSLYTSIIPSLILKGVGQAIAAPQVRHKILILNSKLDRETGGKRDPMTGRDFVRAIARAAGTESWKKERRSELSDEELKEYVSHLVYLEGEGTPVVDMEELQGRLGIVCVKVAGKVDGGMARYDEDGLGKALEEILDS
ncbi:hypothetical protein B0H66DRAFT_530398 [Apodospora peruviana]|uniref:Uncharacterized protein n=1 Tax=Apodospora peruviana TaxID=516989 RepID=A0AAE0IL88_9PEZI|nr:hypothetical protein B0H66DRAFT_530398 [Apodospora peruviana]